MDKNQSIGIIGLGYVGKAVQNKFSLKHNVFTNDINEKCTDDIESLSFKSDIIFLCLPTPMKTDGSCSINILDDVLSNLNTLTTNKDVIIKSTVPPGTCDLFQSKYSNLNIIFNPEFPVSST